MVADMSKSESKVTGNRSDGEQTVVGVDRLNRMLGPGLITGAADDDPSGIATYSQVGAQFGFELGWTMIFSYPLMTAMQGISAGIGAVTGQGIAENLRQYYPCWVLRLAVATLLIANVVNIGTDLVAMAAALHLLVPGSVTIFSIFFGLGSVILKVFVSYRRYVRVLRWLLYSACLRQALLKSSICRPLMSFNRPVLLFGIGSWPSHHGIRRTKRCNLTHVLTVVTAGTRPKAHSPHPSSRKGHRSAGQRNSKALPRRLRRQIRRVLLHCPLSTEIQSRHSTCDA